MKIIIKKTSEIKNVKDGYARNYLIPRGLAVLATGLAVQELEKQQAKIKRQAQKLEKIKLDIELKIGEKGKAFGAITAKDIAEKLKLDKKQVFLEEPIKQPGEYKVTIDLGQGIRPQLFLHVSGRAYRQANQRQSA
ncbi:MAG: 50S ribosomal protein L9 [Candidatus Portnoybacteria bacterium CG23_combo_of_CG06-09_8_20_14_all_37_13]|uniref:Large ribosomal subunit protein bL9 n=1 Tax=Candidatus Portnoybacteria bacterium CG23_combo_of_CG06-09_8_20_14_all_37_13 TaxID=1974819 RepID=A0A2G9YDN6_9BACT|nr:MAG: 50S ribosomal protein L9 [Candidatus Portnoybacteria bacterium CG23_combo_of_CG06-09_8_20_14_all_37_13]